ncbi:DUF4301 family protein [Mesonia aestuariivivens]|uniref:DUF4301 family protein n=1 Tax=Mesonia aestuariivivens TaxID=2796128 RepID=A0ABS6VXS1_9FLAO|nr:DUF4301 family protein [Mesonia aestuariivivens]MBW2960384.1 DUF4301 family protein [Mesonia aestuariivivens]
MIEEAVLNNDDIAQIKKHGLEVNTVKNQLATFQEGIPKVELVSAASVSDGIQSFSEAEIELFSRKYEDSKLDVIKFIPASGAATRMFKVLHQFLKDFDAQESSLSEFIAAQESNLLRDFFHQKENFPFYNDVVKEAKKNHQNYSQLSSDEQNHIFVQTLLDEQGLNFSNLPKGLVPFHKYENHTLTAFEEHLFEASKYSKRKGIAKLHFTVTEEHLEKFKIEFEKIKERVEKATSTKFEVEYSFQKKATDTIAVDFKNQPFRNDQGEILFRPGGHGALIENLNDLDTDLIFIKNIDNVIKQEHVDLIAKHKKALAGELINVQEKIFEILKRIDIDGFNKHILAAANNLLNEKLSVKTTLESEEDVRLFLDRPIRVCGMVVNQGAPGGGPFWVKDGEDNISLQIVEGAQMDNENPEQYKISKNATHFNPVDLVCSVRNYKGEKFDLTQYVNPKKGFITKKSKFGRNLKALELPGLWNGGMAYWNTIFIEVPVITFNPVKNVVDLLSENHQV